MNNQEALQQDFFIYVPSLHDALHANLADCVELTCAQAAADLPPGPADWVKIPLTEELFVYARLLDEEKQVAL